MATLTESVYNIIIDAGLSIPEIWAGTAADNTSVQDGLLSFWPIPGPGATFADRTSNTLYQFDVWHKDLYQAEEYKEEVVMALTSFADIVDGVAMIFNFVNDNGVLWEQDTNVYHYSVVFNIKYARR